MTHRAADATGPARPRPARFRRRGPWLGVVAAIVAVAVVASVQVRAAPPPTVLQRSSGEEAPAVSVPDLVDPEQVIDLNQAAGRPVVLNFFASWCAPCRREMPTFQALHERLDRQVAFIGIDHQDRRDDALDLLAETGVTYPTGYDPAGDVARAYGLFGMPTTVFISAEGEILGRRTGEIDAEELEATINDLLLAR
jgi:cytochrome c biogenesis protein CcmG/thiol:disulfide interchange protein DsbE